VRIQSVFRLPTIREGYAKARFEVFKRFTVLRSFDSIENVNLSEYSKAAFGKYVSIGSRITFLVSAVESATRPKQDSKLLSLGPRFESELFGYLALGYKIRNITALDTFAYSKLVTLGNMHKMEFQDHTFDIVVGGWILAYSNDPIGAMREIYRVTRRDGLAVLTWDIPEGLLDNFKSLDEIFIPGNSGLKTPLNKLITGWELRSLYIGNISWSKNRKVVVVILGKPQ